MIEVAETGSTNDEVKRLAAEGAGEGTWLRADRQTAGRGRSGRAWSSIEGNLHASTLVRVHATDPPTATLALVAGVALFNTAEPIVRRPGLMLKWPNDLLLDGAKVAGVLLERVGDAVVAGFGVNLAFAPEVPGRRTGVLPGAPAPGMFVRLLAVAFADALGNWRCNGLPAIRHAWLMRAHAVGTPLETHASDGERVAGAFDGLDEAGALRLRLPDGGTRVIHAGDIHLV